MGRVTLYLDAETKEKMKSAARTAEVSQSRWVAELIREKTAIRGPESIARMTGAWVDFPTAEELRAGLGEGVPRC